MDPILVTKVEKGPGDAPVLIVDKQGSIGNAMYERIKSELLVVLISSIQPPTAENLIYIPYKNRIPEIPNDVYSLIIFISDQEKDIDTLTKQFITKAKNDHIKFVFMTSYDHLDNDSIEKMITGYEESHTLVLGELFGNESGVSPVDKYIYQAATIGTIQLPHMGLRKTRPVLFVDTIQAILQSIFGIQSQHRITYLYQQHAYTDLSIAHILQKEDPLVHVDFLNDSRKSPALREEPANHLPGHYYFDKEYPLTTKIIEVYKSLQSLKKSKVDAYIYKEEIKPLLNLDEGSSFVIPKQFKKIGLYIIYCLCIAIVLPLIILGIAVISAESSFNAGKQAIARGDIEGAKQHMIIASGGLMIADLTKDPILLELQIIGASNFAQQLKQKIYVEKEISYSLQNLLTSGEEIGQVLLGTASSPDTTVDTAVSIGRMSLISLEKITTNDFSEHTLLDEINTFQKGRDILTGTANLLSQMMGIPTKKTYLILLTNNLELRPGGGFIGAYALVTFDNGKMGGITIHDINDADSQLKQHVDPPFALRRFMGTVHQYVQDSNFDVDFVNDARTASHMFQLATGQHVDGIISMDLTYIRSLLAVTGPVYVSGYKATVDTNNLLILVQEHEQKRTGTVARKDFLQSVYIALEKKLFVQKHIDANELVHGLIQGIQEKHLLFALSDVTSQNILTANNLSSSLWDPRAEAPGVINDFMGITDANIGANNANYFVKRNIKQSISIDGDGTFTGKIDVQYQNGSSGNQEGDYKNYMRVTLPQDTVLTGIAFDGKKQATRSAITDPFIYETKGFTQPNAVEIAQTGEFGKSVYGFPVTIPASTTKTVSIIYAYTKKINLSNPVLHYNLRLFKQPGTDNNPFVLSFNYPLEYSILSSNPPSITDGTSDYSLMTTLSEDKTIIVDLTKK